MIAILKRRRVRRDAALAAYRAIVARSREPGLLAAWAIPDTLDGRFELLSLHAFLVFNRLKTASAKDFSQILFDIMFADLDRGVRELGAGDMGVGKRVKAMARGFYGRVAAYDRGLADKADLEPALRRNLFGTVEPTAAQVASAARYLRAQAAALAATPADALLGGDIRFAPWETTL